MRSDRLLKLADFLETVPEAAFNIQFWQKRAATKPEGERPGDCGFAGCAVGWAAHANLFPGFVMQHREETHDAWPVFGEASSFDAVNDLFEFTNEEADAGRTSKVLAKYYLFSNGYYDTPPTPAIVAARIREFVAKHAEGQ